MGCHPSHWRTPWFFKMVIAPPTSDVDISSGESNLPGEDFLDDALKYVLFGHAPWSKMIFLWIVINPLIGTNSYILMNIHEQIPIVWWMTKPLIPRLLQLMTKIDSSHHHYPMLKSLFLMVKSYHYPSIFPLIPLSLTMAHMSVELWCPEGILARTPGVLDLFIDYKPWITWGMVYIYNI